MPAGGEPTSQVLTSGPQCAYVGRMTETQRQRVPREDGSELATALAFLDFARQSVLKKVDGLSELDLRRPMVESGTSLLGLIRHLTDGEHYWFGVQLLGRGCEPDWSAAATDQRPAEEIIADYQAAITVSNHTIREIADLNASAALAVDHLRMSLRWTIAHMTSETARHAGHADILREMIDGVTGR
jgi:uncharacterized damage-inducible protein DinB